MSMLPWFKLWPSDIMDCAAWRRLNTEERGILMIFFACLGQARSKGEQVTVEDVMHYAGIRIEKARKILAKLERNGYSNSVGSELLSEFFERMQHSKDQTLAERQRKYRVSHRYVTDEQRVTKRTEVEVDVEVEVDISTNVDIKDGNDVCANAPGLEGVNQLSLPIGTNPVKPSKRHERSLKDLEADKITAALAQKIVPLLGGTMTTKTWCSQNHNVARDLHECGLTAEAVAAAWDRLNTWDRKKFTHLSPLQKAMGAEHAAKVTAIAPAPIIERRGWVDDKPFICRTERTPVGWGSFPSWVSMADARAWRDEGVFPAGYGYDPAECLAA